MTSKDRLTGSSSAASLDSSSVDLDCMLGEQLNPVYGNLFIFLVIELHPVGRAAALLERAHVVGGLQFMHLALHMVSNYPGKNFKLTYRLLGIASSRRLQASGKLLQVMIGGFQPKSGK